MKRGKLLVIEGTDGAGKSSQTKLINEYYTSQGLKVKNFHFPTYTHNEFGKVITHFLRGDYGKSDEINPYFVANIYAMDRYLFLGELNKMLNENDVVVLDRYVFSNAAYQAAKYKIDSQEAYDIINWIIEFEFGFLGLPEQDLCLFLNVPTEITEARLASSRIGADREYLDGKEDIHEADVELQRRVHHTYLNMKTISGYNIEKYEIIDCGDKDPVKIFQSYFKLLNNLLK